MSALRILAPLLATAILLVVPARATTTYYTGTSGETAFNTAIAGLTLLNPAMTFSGDLEDNGLLNAASTGIDFLGFDTAFSFNAPISFTLNAGKLIATNSGEVVKIAFPASGIYAFGTHITVASGTGNWCVDTTQAGCGSTFFNSSAANVQFFGFVSDTPFTAPLYIHYATGNPTIVFTDFEAYGPSAVPESRTMLLAGLGLVTFALLRRRQRWLSTQF